MTVGALIGEIDRQLDETKRIYNSVKASEGGTDAKK
jgi:hypothetical protein